MPGKKVIAATFFRLSDQEAVGLVKPEESLDDFPDELVQVMQRYKPVAIEPLATAVTELRSDVDGLRRDIRSHEDWYTRFKESLGAHNQLIGEISKDLKAEVEERKAGQDRLTSTLTWLKGAAWTLAGVLGLALALFTS